MALFDSAVLSFGRLMTSFCGAPQFLQQCQSYYEKRQSELPQIEAKSKNRNTGEVKYRVRLPHGPTVSLNSNQIPKHVVHRYEFSCPLTENIIWEYCVEHRLHPSFTQVIDLVKEGGVKISDGDHYCKAVLLGDLRKKIRCFDIIYISTCQWYPQYVYKGFRYQNILVIDHWQIHHRRNVCFGDQISSLRYHPWSKK